MIFDEKRLTLRAQEAENALRDLIGRQLGDVLVLVEEIQKDDSIYKINFPEQGIVDLPVEEIANYVSRSSNVYGRAARLAGLARAEQKIRKSIYERKYKENQVGKNPAEREKSAIEASKEEHAALSVANSLVDLVESLETSARIASESSRKILDKAQSMMFASYREEKTYNTEDFTP